MTQAKGSEALRKISKTSRVPRSPLDSFSRITIKESPLCAEHAFFNQWGGFFENNRDDVPAGDQNYSMSPLFINKICEKIKSEIVCASTHSGRPELFEPEKGLFLVRIIRKIPTESGSRIIRTTDHL